MKLQIAGYKLQVFLLRLLVTFLSSLITVVFASTVDDIVGLIEQRYNELHDVQGRFTQISYIKDIEKTEKYEGKFYIKKPDNLKWAYSKPRDEEVVIRESAIWIYKKTEKQILKSTYNKDTLKQVPIALLNSLGNLKSVFDITLIKENTLELKPKEKVGVIKKIYLEVITGDFPVKAFTVFDAYGNKIDIVVKNVKINHGIEDSFFILKPPPGVEVIDLNQ